jgi:hypothetical protein
MRKVRVITGQERPEVLAVYPDAYVRQWRETYMIVRPRTADDSSSIITYVALSTTHLSEDLAWFEAVERLHGAGNLKTRKRNES